MQRAIWWLIAILGLGIGGFIVYNAMKKTPPPPVVSAPRAEAPPAPVPPPEPQVHFPVPETPAAKTLPALEDSDAAVSQALGALMPGKGLSALPVFKNFVRHVVATVDNLPAKKLAPRLLPLQRPGGAFAVSRGEQGYTVDARNAARYAPYVRLAKALDSAKLMTFYFEHYPLFQQAYRDLGYPQGQFNDRLVAVIDHLLAAPDAPQPLALVRPKVFYLYADPELEARSAGQKILMRIGPDNAAAIKARLREVRAEIARQSARATSDKP